MTDPTYRPVSRPVDLHTAMPEPRRALAERDPELPPLPVPLRIRSTDEGAPRWMTFIRDWHRLLGFAAGLALVATNWHLLDDPEVPGSTAFVFVFVVPALVGIAVSMIAQRVAAAAVRSQHKAWRDQEQAQLKAYNDHAWQQWVSTRPLHQVTYSPTPRQRLREVMADYGASLYLGVVPDTQTLATAGRQASVLVLAPSQSGKTTTLAAPMVLAHYGAAVVTSTKEDLVDFTIGERASRGTAWIYDPAGVWEDKLPPGARIAHWSPLWEVTDWDSALLTTTTMIGATSLGRGGKEDHWVDMAKGLLAPCMLAAAFHQDATMLDVSGWVLDRYFVVPREILAQVAEDPTHPGQDDAQMAQRSLNSMLLTIGDQSDGIMTTTARVLAAYNTKGGRRSATRQTFDPAAFVRSTDTLYVASPSKQQSTFAPLIVALIDAIQQAGYDFNREDPFHASTRPSLLMCLDETANISPMRDLPRYLSEAGGQGVQMVVYLQSLGQAMEIWPAQAPAFLDLFATIVAFGGLSDHTTLEALSALSGDFDRTYVSYTFSSSTSSALNQSKGKSWSWSFLQPGTDSSSSGTSESSSSTRSSSESHHKERRLSPADIASLPPRHTLVISKLEQARDKNFAIVEMTPVYEAPWTMIRAQAPAVIELRAADTAERVAPHRFPLLADFAALVRARDLRKQREADSTP